MIVAIRHFAIEVNDFVAAFRFYTSLGFVVFYHALENWWGEQGKEIRHIVKLRAPQSDALLEVIERIPAFEIKETAYSNTHICFQCNNIEATCKELEAKGCKVIVPLRPSPDKSVRLAFYKDPFGLTLELVEVTNAKRGDNPSESRVEAHPEQEPGESGRVLNFGMDYQGGPTTAT